MFLQSLSNYSVVFSITTEGSDMNQLYQAEGFYNFKELCCAVLHQDLAAADDTLERQSSFLFAQGSCPVEAMRIFLTSMNRSIYNYLLYAQDLSLHKCCFQNLCLSHACRSKEEFFSAARQMIRNYCQQFQSPDGYSCHVMRAKEYIEENLAEPLRLSQVAQQIHISTSHLSELFTKCTGTSFSNYVKQRRLERANQLLLCTQATIQDVALSCGFSTPAYFSTVFTKWSGMSPRQYRAKRQSNQTA